MNRRIPVALMALLASAACSSPDDSSGDLHLELVAAPASVTPGAVTPQAVLVKVVSSDNTPVAGVPVSWSVRSGGGRIDASADTSGVDGLAAALWTPGLTVGVQEIAASIYGDPALVIPFTTDAFHADRIDAGYEGVCGLQGTATWCWVRGRYNNQTFRLLSQVQAKALALSDTYACVVDVAGSTYCNIYYWYQPIDPDQALTVAALPPIDKISAGDNVFCGIAAADGTPWCWGGSLSATQVSPTLHLTSIAVGNSYACGLADDGAAWCWESSSPPTTVPGGHAFRQVSVGNSIACGIEAPALMYCWRAGQLPTLMAGVSPAAIAMGYEVNLMNVQSGVRSFLVDVPRGEVVFIDQADLPLPATEMSADDNSCVIAVTGIVYCMGMNYSGFGSYGTNWAAIPAPEPTP